MERLNEDSRGDERIVLHCVIGAHKHTPIPDEVRSHELRHRFAVIVDPHRESRMPLETVASIVSAILLEISAAFSWSRVVATMPDGTEYGRLSDVTGHVLADHSLNLPARVCYYRDEQLVCVEVTENWAALGGPQPYSDSHTFSFYTPWDWALRFIHACERVCARHPAALGRLYAGSIDTLGRSPSSFLATLSRGMGALRNRIAPRGRR